VPTAASDSPALPYHVPVLAAAVRDWATGAHAPSMPRSAAAATPRFSWAWGSGLGIDRDPMQLQQLACDSAPRLSSTAKALCRPCRPCRHPGLPSRSHPARPGVSSHQIDTTERGLPSGRRAARYADGGLGAGDKGPGFNTRVVIPPSLVPSPQSPIRISSGAPGRKVKPRSVVSI